MAPERLQQWRELCAWFEDQPYNASYRPLHVHGCPHTYLLMDEPSSLEGSPEERRYWRSIVAERRALQVIYWQGGYGWRLRKDYREKLDAQEA